MGLKSGFPTYPSGINYAVSFSFPGPSSGISKSVGANGASALMVPNANFLVEFIKGNLGISDGMLKSMMFKNMNSPVASSNEMVFRSFSETNKLNLDSDSLKYKKGNKFSLPKDQVKLSPENDLVGLKGLEVTTLKSIFETQKPYMEVAKLVIGNLAKMEDICARVMPLLGVPLTTKSKKPKGNPNAIGYQGGAVLKSELARIEAIRKKGGETKFGPGLNGGVIRTKNSGEDDGTSTSNGNGNNGPVSTYGDWKVISTVYSTGLFDPNSDYLYKYINLPPDDELGKDKSDLDLELDAEADPYMKYKPKTIIFGIFDSRGNPLNPLSKVKGIDNLGDKVDTNHNKAGWILNSPKWVFRPNVFQWPVFAGAQYYGLDSEGNAIKYGEGQTNVLNGERAIPGTPIVTGFNTVEETEYKEFFSDLINIKMLQVDDLSNSEKNDISNEINSSFNRSVGRNGKVTYPIKSHLENVFNWGQAKSSYYQRIGIPSAYLQKNGLSFQDDPYPENLKKSFKPLKIYSNEASGDEKLKAYARSKGRPESDAGWIWIDPEADYITKVIRVDPTTKIKYQYQQGEPEIESEIKSFVKNVAVFELSDNREFNIEVYRRIGSTTDEYTEFEISNNVTSYNLENWNYVDNDGIISQFGVVNEEPIINNSNSYKITMWGDTPTEYYNNGDNFFLSTDVVGNALQIDEVRKVDDKWSFYKSEVDLTNAPNGVELLTSSELVTLFNNYTINSGYVLTLTVPTTTGTGSSASTSNTIYTIVASAVFSNRQNITQDGKQRLIDKSLVEVENGFITKWYYMTPSDDNSDYGNGNWNGGLPNNGIRRSIVVDVNTIGGNVNTPTDSSSDTNIPQFQIRVRDDDSTGRIIDPSKILNTELTKEDAFSDDKYGHGSLDDQQRIDVIKRYMLTELDTESYYIIEGILPEFADDAGRFKFPGNSQNGNQPAGGGGGGYYKLPHAIGAMKVFMSIITDIFSKLIPLIKKIISMFKNPASFVTEIISEQMGKGFAFALSESKQAFSSGKQFNVSGGDKREKKQKVRVLQDHFKASSLSNFVFVKDDGKFASVLDGVASIPFSIFGKSLTFGMEMNFGNLPSSPIKLSYATNSLNSKSLQSFISPESFDSTNASNLTSQLGGINNNTSTNNQYPFNPNNLGDDKNNGNNTDDYINKTKIEFEDGTSIFIENNELSSFVVDNSSKYDFIYVTEDVKNKINEADSLIETGDEDNLLKAQSILDDVSKKDPNNKAIDERKSDVKNKLGRIQGGDQPLLKMLLGLVTLPIKILGGILEWIMDFFKSLTNPLTLPSKIKEFLSFSWITQFFSPTGLLEMIGIKFDPSKITSLDLSQFLSVAFGAKLPTFTKEQFAAIDPKMGLRFMTALFCFVENLINAIIDFIWSTLGIEAVIPPPHIKLCSDTDIGSMKPEDIAKILSGEIPSGQTKNYVDVDGDGVADVIEDDVFKGFIYEVKLPSGEKKEFLNREALDEFIGEHKDLNYDFEF